MQQIFSALGTFKQESLLLVSDKLYKNGYYEDDNFIVSLCCIGKQVNDENRNRFPNVP